MKKIIIIAFFAFTLGLSRISAQTVLSDDTNALKAQELFLLNGELLPVFTWPVSAEFLCFELAQLAERAPELADEIGELILSILPSENLLVFYGVRSNLQYRIGGVTGLSSEGEDRFIDIKRVILDAPNFADLDFSIGNPLGIGLGAALNLRREWMHDYSADTNIPEIGLSGNPVAFDNHMTEYADLFYNAQDWSFYFGRSAMHWGQLNHSSLYVAESVPYLDRAGVNVRLGLFRFDWFMASIQNVRSADGFDIVPDSGFGFESDGTPSVTWFSAKRFSFQGKTWCLGIGELLLYSRRGNYLLLTDFLPVIDWHSTDVRPNNMIVYLDFTWVPYKGIKVFAMAGFDDVSGDIFGVADGEIPTIPAYIAGIDTAYKINKEISVSARAELGWTHYLWGNFDAQRSSLADYSGHFARAVFRYISDEGAILIPLTSPYGPGTFWLNTYGLLKLRNLGLQFGVDCVFLWKYPDVDLVRTGYFTQSEYSGFPPFYYARTEIFGTYANKLMEVSLAPGFEIGRGGVNLFLSLRVSIFNSGYIILN